MTPLLVSGSDTKLPGTCPESLDYRPGGDVRPFVAAIGTFALDGDRGQVLTRAWSELVAHVEDEASRPGVRVLVKHYPRPDLPGRCVGVHVSFCNVPDPYLDPIPYRRRPYRSDLPPFEGVLFEFHKTYQLEPEPRLIAAWIEVQEEIRPRGTRQPLGGLLGPGAGRVGQDRYSSMHYEMFGAGVRTGLAWFDRSAGVGAPDPWACTFRRQGTSIDVDDLDADGAAALIAIVQRA